MNANISRDVAILCATDFSASATAALQRAAALAHDCRGTVELMHVIPRGATPVYRIAGWQADRHAVVAEAMARLEAAAREARAKLRVPVTPYLSLGVAHAQIAARADTTRARLVVVGSHGRRAMRDLLVGSTVHELRRMLRVPLLVARNRSVRGYGHALVAVDFSPASAAAAQATARLLPDAALHFLHVCNPPFVSRLAMADGREDASPAYRNQALLVAAHELDAFIRRNGLQPRRASSLVKHGYPPAVIRQTAGELRASLVALGTEEKSWLSTLAASVGREFLRDAGPDVLLAKAPAPLRDPRLRGDDSRRESVVT
jgi:nucleotide-binding universal stress UspA family protein